MTLRSKFLEASRGELRSLVAKLRGSFDFISILGTDCAGTNFEVFPSERRASESMWTERGFVFRAARDGRIVEHSVDVLPRDAAALAAELDALLSAAAPGGSLSVGLRETSLRASHAMKLDANPLETPPELILDRLEKIRARAAATSPLVAMARTRAEWALFSKLYISSERELDQSYLWGQVYVIVTARKDGKTRQSFVAASGRKGLELLDELEFGRPAEESASLPSALPFLAPPEAAAAMAVELLDATPMDSGEFTVVLSPDMAGMLAHEAFGHGVETDMMAKGRSKARHYLGKRVGSELVTMYDGAAAAEQTGSFAFDDEGTEGASTLVLDKGILRSGISDLLSARELGIGATGNGRRWSYERKAYARMTNTYFAPGSSSADELIRGVEYGWLIDRPNSGMEDPKNWGIQLVALIGREIRNGRLTGRVASPVVCTGSVPEVLGAVDGIGAGMELNGNGYCGKGYKEFVKVSSGGPWMRTKMRLG